MRQRKVKDCETAPPVPVFQHDVGYCSCGAESWLYSFALYSGPLPLRAALERVPEQFTDAGERMCGACVSYRARRERDDASDERRCA